MMTKLLLLLIHLRIIVQCSLVAGPSNTAVVAGQRLEMECRTNNGTKVREWTIQRTLTFKELKIFTNFETSRNRIDSSFKHFGADVDSNGSGFIYSNTTRRDDAGLYTCRVQEGQRQQIPYSAQVTVLDKEPFCERKPERNLMAMDTIWFKCSVNFTGNMAPTMEWRQHCGDMTLNLSDAFITIATNSSVTSTLNLNVQSSDSLCNVSCRTFFTMNSRSTNIAAANNTPDYNYIWDFSVGESERTDTTISTVENSHVTIVGKADNAVMTILIVVLTVVGLVVAMVVVCCLCCACYKRKITEFLIQMASNAQGANSNQTKRLSRSKIPLPRPPHAYTPMEKILGQSSSSQESKKVLLRCNQQPEGTSEAGAAVDNETYSIGEENEPASAYATLSRGIEPPKADNVYAKKGHSFYDGRVESTYEAITDSVFMETPDDTCDMEGTCAQATADPCVEDSRLKVAGTKAPGGNCVGSPTAESTCAKVIGDVCTQSISFKSAESSIYDEATEVSHDDSTDIAYSVVTDVETSDIYDEATDVNRVQSRPTDSTIIADNTYSAITDSVHDPNTDSMYAVVNDV